MTTKDSLERLLPLAKRLALEAGRLSAPRRMLPSFLICGAQRCGTTSMYQALRQHRAILRPVLNKGIHYFDVAYPRGISWYRAHFPLAATARRQQDRCGEPVQAFESSPYYLFHPLAAQRIASDLPGVRVIILVRDPVERAYSAYTHEFARGYEVETFERALELETERLAGEEEKIRSDPDYNSHAHQHQAYIGRGKYFAQISHMIDALGSGRVHVVDAEDFFTDPWSIWAEVADFLKISAEPAPKFKQHNARPRSALDPSLRRAIESEFEESDAQLEEWWGRVPSWRR